MPHHNDHILPPLTRQLKAELVDLARELHLDDNGRVADLRPRIRDYLTGNPKLLVRQRYANLLPKFDPADVGAYPPSWHGIGTSQSTRHGPTNTSRAIPDESFGQRGPLRNQTPQSSPPLPRQPAKGRPEITPGCVAKHQLFVIPEIVQKEVIRGWLNHIPLTYLTDRYCILGSDLKIKRQDFKINKRTTDLLPAELPHDDAEEEYALSFEDWYRASLRFLDLLQAHQPALYAPWKSHFDRIRDAPDSMSNWSTWLAYDITMRKQSTYRGVDPSVFHEHFWLHLNMESIKEPVFSPGPHNPYDDQSRSHQTRWRTSHRCFRCGGPHSARGCTSDTQVSGFPVVLIPRRKGRSSRDADGNRYCFAFNGFAGCTNSNCPKGFHWCSLCKGTEHDAQSCPFI